MMATTTKAKIGKAEVRGFTSFDTDDGYAFKASLYLDGVRAAVVRNGGTGGPNDWDWTKRGVALRESWDAFVDAHEAAIDPDTGSLYPIEREDIVFEALIEAFEERKALKRILKTKVLFRVAGDGTAESGEWRTVAHKGRPEAARAWLAAKFGAGSVVFAEVD